MSGLRSRSVPAPGRRRWSRRTPPRCCGATPPSTGDRRRDPVRRPDVDPRRVLRGVVPVRAPLPGPAAARRPRHVAVLLDNTPEYLFAFGGAALAGAAVVGLNHTRRGEHLLRDVAAHALRARDHRAAARRRCSRRSPPTCRRCSRRPASPTTTTRTSTLGESLDDALGRYDATTRASSPTSTRSGR